MFRSKDLIERDNGREFKFVLRLCIAKLCIVFCERVLSMINERPRMARHFATGRGMSEV